MSSYLGNNIFNVKGKLDNKVLFLNTLKLAFEWSNVQEASHFFIHDELGFIIFRRVIIDSIHPNLYREFIPNSIVTVEDCGNIIYTWLKNNPNIKSTEHGDKYCTGDGDNIKAWRIYNLRSFNLRIKDVNIYSNDITCIVRPSFLYVGK